MAAETCGFPEAAENALATSIQARVKFHHEQPKMCTSSLDEIRWIEMHVVCPLDVQASLNTDPIVEKCQTQNRIIRASSV